MIKVGVFFGGFSHEREVSFNGGRNVCQYIDRNIFQPVPIFVDSFGNFVQLDWQHFERTSIRDFYPNQNSLPQLTSYRIYAESLGELSDQHEDTINNIGKKIAPDQLPKLIDFALIALHGVYGEDGNLQGLLEWYGIPYSGSGVFGSALGIDKALQNRLIANVSGQDKKFTTFSKTEFLAAPAQLLEKLVNELALPLVIKAPHQGSSIGVGILKENDIEKFIETVYNSLFIRVIKKDFWTKLSSEQQKAYLQELLELDKGLGMPLVLENELIYYPDILEKKLHLFFENNHKDAVLTAKDGEEIILVEEFVKGREFTCAVIQKESGSPFALLPSEAQKASDALFDFDSKYKGLVKEIIVMEAAAESIEKIRREAEKVFANLGFQVYIRMDGFLMENGEICFHDPNTIPGMSPASFIFKQFAELGFTPTQTISFLIRTSLAERLKSGKNRFVVSNLLADLDKKLTEKMTKNKVALIFGDEKSYQLAKEEMKPLLATGTNQVTFLAKVAEKYKVFTPNLMFRDSFEEALYEWESPQNSYIVDLVRQSADLRAKYVSDILLEKQEIGLEDLKNFEKVHIVPFQEYASI